MIGCNNFIYNAFNILQFTIYNVNVVFVVVVALTFTFRIYKYAVLIMQFKFAWHMKIKRFYKC